MRCLVTQMPRSLAEKKVRDVPDERHLSGRQQAATRLQAVSCKLQAANCKLHATSCIQLSLPLLLLPLPARKGPAGFKGDNEKH